MDPLTLATESELKKGLDKLSLLISKSQA